MVHISNNSLQCSSNSNHQQNIKADELIKWSEKVFGSRLVMTTSFGIQSAVMLHLVTKIRPKIPVIWIDTGYFHKATYQFAEELTQRLELNLKVYQSSMSPARMEALHGKLWEQGDLEACNLYDYIRKVEPMQRALKELNAKAWLAGLRSQQTQHRQTLKTVTKQGDIYKIHPILNWSSREIYQYLTTYDLPYHPYFDQGYVTVGDWHSSRPLAAYDNHERETRFNGLKQECGLHLPQNFATESQHFSEIRQLQEIEAEVKELESPDFSAQDLNLLVSTSQLFVEELKASNLEAHHPSTIKILEQITKKLKTSLKSVNQITSINKEEVEQILTAEEKEYLKIIQNSVRNINSLVNEI